MQHLQASAPKGPTNGSPQIRGGGGGTTQVALEANSFSIFKLKAGALAPHPPDKAFLYGLPAGGQSTENSPVQESQWRDLL